MLQSENEYETPIESDYYQNNRNHFPKSDNTQKNYTEQELKGTYWKRVNHSGKHAHRDTRNLVSVLASKSNSDSTFNGSRIK